MPGTRPRSRSRRCTESVTLPRKSAAIVLPSMIRAVMDYLMLRPVGEALARSDDFLQRRDQGWAVARNGEPLDARGGAGDQRDVARWDARRLGDQPAQRLVGLALARRGAHPRLQHGPPVGQ